MCKARKDGGQRCHSHALAAFEAAKARFHSDMKKNSKAATENMRRRIVDLASTKAGQETVRAMTTEQLGVWTGGHGVTGESIAYEGELLRARNARLGDVTAKHRWVRRADKAASIVHAMKTTVGLGAATAGAAAVAAWLAKNGKYVAVMNSSEFIIGLGAATAAEFVRTRKRLSAIRISPKEARPWERARAGATRDAMADRRADSLRSTGKWQEESPADLLRRATVHSAGGRRPSLA